MNNTIKRIFGIASLVMSVYSIDTRNVTLYPLVFLLAGFAMILSAWPEKVKRPDK